MDLPHNIVLYVLLVIAVGAGYLLGKKERQTPRPQQAVIKDYYQGLNFLLGERPELGVDRFIDATEVSDQTIDVHLAMAGVVRRRGEFDKAIRIHQNLLASPVLSNANKQLVELELARDYHTCGLLDRAEKLLLQILARKSTQEVPARELLLDLYEQEREWAQALEVGQKLIKSHPQVRVRLGHFYCELAQAALADKDTKRAVQLARKAIEQAPNQARGHWLLAQIELVNKRHKQVIRHVQKAVEYAPELAGEFFPACRSACESLQNDQEYERFLQNALRLYPDPKLLAELIEFRRVNGNELEVEEVLQHIERAPGYGHLPLLLDMAQRSGDMQTVQQQVGEIVKLQTAYQCTNCGFTSPNVQWQCPGCRTWGSFGAAGRVKAAT